MVSVGYFDLDDKQAFVKAPRMAMFPGKRSVVALRDAYAVHIAVYSVALTLVEQLTRRRGGMFPTPKRPFGCT